jgi:hypothetical protein
MTHSYQDIAQLKSIYLEESFVLGIVAGPGTVEFDMDLVLTAEHPRYTPPPPSETFCFRRALITFDTVESLVWDGQGGLPATDSTGEKDYGNIDTFTWVGNRYQLVGDWGRIVVHSASPNVRIRA